MRAALGKPKQRQFWAGLEAVPAGGLGSCGAEPDLCFTWRPATEGGSAALGRAEVQRGPGRGERGCDVMHKLPLVQTASEPARGVVAPVACSGWVCCSGMMVLEGISFPVN